MKENFKKNIIMNDRIFALFLTAISLMVFVFTDPKTSIAGDVNISRYISSNMEPGFYFLSTEVALPLNLLAKAIPLVNWWALFSILMMFLSNYWILVNIQNITRDDKHNEKIHAVIIACIIWLFFFWDGINFTQTATLLALAAVSSVLSITSEDTKKEVITKGIISVVYFCIACGVRWASAIMGLPFLFMVVCFKGYLLIRGGEGLGKTIVICRNTLIMCGIIVAITGGFYGLHKVYPEVDPIYKEASLATTYRSDIYDWPDRVPSYKGNEELYENLGVKESWLNMVLKNYTSDKNFFSSDQIYPVTLIRGKSQSGIMDFLLEQKSHADAVLIMGIALVIIFVSSGFITNIIPALLSLVSVIAATVFFLKMGRFPWRVTNSYLFFALFSMVVMISYGSKERKKKDIKASGLRTYLLYLMMFLTLATTVVRKDFSLPSPKAYSKEDAIVMDYMNRHKEKVFFTIYNYYYVWNLWSAKSIDYLDNEFAMEACFNDGRIADKEKYGITDIISQMLSESRILTVYDKVWHDYLRDYYGDTISAGVVEYVPDTNATFIRYVRPLEAREISDTVKAGKLSFEVLSQSEKERNGGYSRISVLSEIDNDVYDEYYLNVVDNTDNKTYTYPLMKQEGNTVTGEIYKVDGTWDEDADFQLIGVTNGAAQIIDTPQLNQ